MKPNKGSLTGLGVECIPGVSENQGKANTSGKSQYSKGSGTKSFDPLGASSDSRPHVGDNKFGNPVPGPSGKGSSKGARPKSTK